MNNERGAFKGKEIVAVIKKLTGKTSRGREVAVSIEKVRPIFASPGDGPDTKGRPQIDVVLTRGKGKFSLHIEEALVFAKLLAEISEDAKQEMKRQNEESESWKERSYAPRNKGDDRKPQQRRTGKTERKKALGKAGHVAHRARKARISQESREIGNAQGKTK